jgi:putative transcriptional regulator
MRTDNFSCTPLVTLKDYGRITLSIGFRMDSFDISINQMSRATGLRYEVVARYYSGHVERIDTDVLAKICCVLNCNVSDIIQYEKRHEKELIVE